MVHGVVPMINVPIYINDRIIGHIDIIRQDDDHSNGRNPDGMNEYRAEVYEGTKYNMQLKFSYHLQHRYGDGAFELVRKVLNDTAHRIKL